MPPLKSSPIKPGKSMLFFHIWSANLSVTSINSQMYMTKPKQVQKKHSENTGKTFSVIMFVLEKRESEKLRLNSALLLLQKPQNREWE